MWYGICNLCGVLYVRNLFGMLYVHNLCGVLYVRNLFGMLCITHTVHIISYLIVRSFSSQYIVGLCKVGVFTAIRVRIVYKVNVQWSRIASETVYNDGQPGTYLQNMEFKLLQIQNEAIL